MSKRSQSKKKNLNRPPTPLSLETVEALTPPSTRLYPSPVGPRSRAEVQKKYREKQKTITKVVVELPDGGLSRNDKEPVHLLVDSIVCSTGGNILIQLWKGVVGDVHISKLLKTTTLVQHQLASYLKTNPTARGNEMTTHVGCWRKSQQEPTITAATRDYKELKWWATENEKCFERVANLFESLSEPTYKRYQELKLPMKLGNLWGCCAINFNWGEIYEHVDSDDYKDGFCTVLTFGKYMVVSYISQN